MSERPAAPESQPRSVANSMSRGGFEKNLRDELHAAGNLVDLQTGVMVVDVGMAADIVMELLDRTAPTSTESPARTALRDLEQWAEKLTEGDAYRHAGRYMLKPRGAGVWDVIAEIRRRDQRESGEPQQ